MLILKSFIVKVESYKIDSWVVSRIIFFPNIRRGRVLPRI